MIKKPFIISISGISGSGKTTASNALKETLNNALILYFDTYDDMLNKDFFDWSDRGADYNEWNLSPMIDDVKKAIAESPDFIILDYPFGYGNSEMAKLIDYAVYVETPLDIAMARRVIRDYTERDEQRNKIGDLFENLGNTMKAYLNHDRMMYTTHAVTVRPNCDLMVDGTQNIVEIVAQIKKAVALIE